MADEDIDNDTVFLEGSPLYELFKNNDFDLGDFEMSQKVDQNTKPLLETAVSSSFISDFWKCVSNLIPLSYVMVNSNPDAIYESVANVMIDSNLLHSTDQSLLKGFLDEYNLEKPCRSEPKHFNVLLVVLCAFIAACVPLCNALIYPFCALFTTILAIYCLRKRQSRCHAKFQRELNEFVLNLKQFWKVCRKSLRVIQEAEVIARGLTFASVKSTTIESTVILPTRYREKQCPELRCSVFKYCQKHFMSCRNATRKLLIKYPLIDGLDMASHYLSNVELDELGPLICVNVDDTENILSVTDDFSTPALKTIIQLTDAQESELLRRIAFCFLSGKNVFNIYKDISESLSEISENLSKFKNGLDKMLLYYTLIGRNDNRKKLPAANLNHPIKSFRISVRSLCLHLQVALVRLQDLENNLEISDDNDSDDISKGIVKDLGSKCLNEVKSELDAARVCYDDCLSRSLNINNEGGTQNVNSLNIETPKINAESNLNKIGSPPLDLIQMGDPVIEDEVFEGLAEFNLEKNQFDEDDFPIIRSQKGPVILLNELKTVLAVKAEERKVREAKALGIDPSDIPDTNSPLMSSDPASNQSRESLKSEERKFREAKDLGIDPSGIPDTPSPLMTSDHPASNQSRESLKVEERKFREAKDLGIDPSDIPDTPSPLMTSDHPASNESRESLTAVENNLPSNETLETLKLKAMSSQNTPFMTSIAAQVALKSRMFGLKGRTTCNEDVLGESDSDVD